jgi:CRISPR type III-A-associated protein Csm2
MYNNQHNRGYQQGNRTTPQKIDFDFLKDGKLNLDWLDSKAQNFAQNKIGQKHNEVKYSQIRTFYDEFQVLRAMPFKDKEFQNNVIPLLKLLKAKITNRQNRNVLDRNQYFKHFIIELVDMVKDPETLKTACMIFEAVVGYFPNTK